MDRSETKTDQSESGNGQSKLKTYWSERKSDQPDQAIGWPNSQVAQSEKQSDQPGVTFCQPKVLKD